MSFTSESIRYAGDVAFKDVSVVTSKGTIQNIANQVLGLEIYEDIFSPFITGVAVIKESFDLINLMPFVGEEFLNININTPTLEDKHAINQQFYIFKISNRILSGDRTAYYELHFISREAIVDVNKKISKAYGGLISDLAKELITSKEFGLESSKTPNIEATSNRTKFISNYWSPVKCLSYLTATAATSSGGANYLFFENRKGLNFVSIESLYDQELYQRFIKGNYARDIESDGRAVINLNKDYQQIIELDTPEVSNYIDSASSGMYSSKMVGSDITMKKYFSKNFDMLEDFTRTKHLNDFAPHSSNLVKHPNSTIIQMEKYYSPFNGFTEVSNAKTIQRRISQLQQAQTGKLELTVFGRTDYTVGMKVEVKLNMVRPFGSDEQDTTDKMLSGKYIVSAINHKINRDKHECIMELIKDSYIIDVNKGGN